jgi:hypothetical protein
MPLSITIEQKTNDCSNFADYAECHYADCRYAECLLIILTAYCKYFSLSNIFASDTQVTQRVF